MNEQEFRKLVADMRHAQKEYFRTRSGNALSESKKLEKKVDEELAKAEESQGRLFD